MLNNICINVIILFNLYKKKEKQKTAHFLVLVREIEWFLREFNRNVFNCSERNLYEMCLVVLYNL